MLPALLRGLASASLVLQLVSVARPLPSITCAVLLYPRMLVDLIDQQRQRSAKLSSIIHQRSHLDELVVLLSDVFRPPRVTFTYQQRLEVRRLDEKSCTPRGEAEAT